MRSIPALVATAMVLVLAVSGGAAQTASPVSVEGDVLLRLVSSRQGEGDILAAGAGGLFRLQDDTWSRVGPPPPAGELVSSGGENAMMLAGDHIPCMQGGAPTNTWRSDDGGASWHEVAGPTDLRPLAIWADSGLALAASCSGLQYSLDLGLSWVVLPGIEAGWEITAFAEVASPAGGAPVVLVGLTSEGGSSRLVRVDLTEPTAPVISETLREYYALAGLAAYGDTIWLAAMDGVWESNDAGATWERSAGGLDGVVLEQDPYVHGLPADFDPGSAGLYALAMVPGTEGTLLVGTVDGLYVRPAGSATWELVPATSGRVSRIALAADGQTVAYQTEAGVSTVSLVDR